MATPYTASCNIVSLSTIDGGDCIGDSLGVINDNTKNTADGICLLQTAITNASATLDSRITNLSAFVKSLSAKDSSTIDFEFNSDSYILSANVIDSSLGTIKLGQDVTTFGKHLLTSTNIYLSSLEEVQLSSPVAGQGLIWNGTKWANGTLALTVNGLSGLLVDRDYGDITVSNNTIVWTINPGAVNQTELAANAVVASKIYNGAVLTDKIANDAVTADKIANNAVTTAKITNDAVTADKIANNAVTTAKIASNNVTDPKLAQIPGYTIKGNPSSTTDNVTNITASTSNTVLRYTGSTLDFGPVPNEATTGTTAPNTNTLVLRDGSGSFQAYKVTADTAQYGFVGNLYGRALSADQADTAVLATSANRADIANSANTANSATTAETANQLTTARNIALAGAVTGNVNFNGTEDVTINTLPGPGVTSNYFRATEVYPSTNTNEQMSIRTLYAGNYNVNTNDTPTASGTTLDSKPTNVWRRFNAVEYSASFASIEQFNNVWGTYIDITRPGLYEIHAGGTLAGARTHCIVLLQFDPTVGAPIYTPIAAGTIISNDTDAKEDSTTSVVGGRFSFTGSRTGVALGHIYRNDETTAKDVLLGSESFPSPWNPTWLTDLLPNVVTAWFEVKKIS